MFDSRSFIQGGCSSRLTHWKMPNAVNLCYRGGCWVFQMVYACVFFSIIFRPFDQCNIKEWSTRGHMWIKHVVFTMFKPFFIVIMFNSLRDTATIKTYDYKWIRRSFRREKKCRTKNLWKSFWKCKMLQVQWKVTGVQLMNTFIFNY
jgi:hypothetical protein